MKEVMTTGNSYESESVHYKEMGVEPWDVIDTWPLEQKIGYYRGNALKYSMRMGSKDDRLKEAKKIRHYADKLIESLEEFNKENKT
jgi:hypothetical protein